MVSCLLKQPGAVHACLGHDMCLARAPDYAQRILVLMRARSSNERLHVCHCNGHDHRIFIKMRSVKDQFP
jgi:hypothetical protein